MSLEAAIQENTSVLRELLARLAGATIAVPTTQVEAKKSVKTDSPAAGQVTAQEKSQVAAPVTTADAPTPDAQSVAADAPASTVATTITYDQVAKAITDGVKADRAKVVAALAQFGAKKGTELKADQYTAFLAAL